MIKVTTNDATHVKEQLTAKGKVLVPFTSSPKYANFRQLEEATTPMPVTVTIKRGDGGPLNLEIVDTGVKGIWADLQEIKAGEHYELVVVVTPPQKPGRLRSWVKIKTGVEEMPETTVPVYAEVPAGWAEG